MILKLSKLAKFNVVMISHCILIDRENFIQWTYTNQTEIAITHLHRDL